MDQSQDVSMVIYEELDSRARTARRAAWLSVGLIILIVFSLIFFFFQFVSLNVYFPTSRITQSEASRLAAPKGEPGEIAKMHLELEQLKAQIEKEEQGRIGLITLVSSAVLRIGAVVVGLYLVQILFGITRYHFRLADHLYILARALKMTKDDLNLFGQVMTVSTITHIDFGKLPTTPVDKVLDIVKEALGKMKTG